MSQGVINNGGNRVTYKGKTYYWKYSSQSISSASSRQIMNFNYFIDYSEDVANTLIYLDKNGQEKTIYEGTGFGNIWIYSKKADNKWFSIKLDGTDEKSYEGVIDINAVCDKGLIVRTGQYNGDSIALLKKDTTDLENIKENAVFCYFEDNKIYYQEYTNSSSNYRKFGSIDINGENDLTLVNLSVQDWEGEELDYEMRIPVHVDCVQIVDDDIYFQYGGYDGSGYIYQGGKIAKVKKDGTGFTNLKDIEVGSYTSFTVYKNGDDIEIKERGPLNEPFYEYEHSNDYSSSSTTVSICTDENSDKKELLSKEEYKSLGCDEITELDYTGNEFYFIAIQLDEDGYYVQKCTFYKKDLKTNKIEKMQEIVLESH